ncbi:unnamed protein product, partial [Heterotrigona itama]
KVNNAIYGLVNLTVLSRNSCNSLQLFLETRFRRKLKDKFNLLISESSSITKRKYYCCIGEILDKRKNKEKKMVRGLPQWTKTLSFPARVSPQRPAKESKGFHVSPSASPTSPPSPINDNMDKAPIITDE